MNLFCVKCYFLYEVEVKYECREKPFRARAEFGNMEKLFWCVISGVVVLSWQVHTGNLSLDVQAEPISPETTSVTAQ